MTLPFGTAALRAETVLVQTQARHRVSVGCGQKLLGMNEQVGRYPSQEAGPGRPPGSMCRLCLAPAVPGPQLRHVLSLPRSSPAHPLTRALGTQGWLA